jgi:nucleoside-diphosphate-sugar epimerase
MNSIFNNAKILITGGGGYLGSKLAEKLVNYNSTISLVDIYFNDLSEKLNKTKSNITLYECDITNCEQLTLICKKINPTIIYHFAALLERNRDFSLYPKLYKVNVEGTYNLLQALSTCNYIKFIFSSSSEVYGTTNKSPFAENQIPLPASPYSLTKLMAEELIRTYSTIKHKPYTIMRLFNFYADDMPENFFYSQLVNTLIRNEEFKMTSGEQIRDFLPVEQVLDYIIKLTETNKNNYEIVNICSGTGIQLKEFALKTAKTIEKEHLLKIGSIEYRDNEVWVMVGNNNLLSGIICNND